MGRGSSTKEYLAMKIDEGAAAADLISADFQELIMAAKRLIDDASTLAGHHHAGFATHLLKWLASFAAIYLLILDRTNWRTNMLTSLLVPYIFLSLPSGIFHLVRGEVGKWVALVAVVLRLFFHRHFPEWTQIPGSMILLLVVAPDIFAHHVRESWLGKMVLLVIACYLLQEHIRATGGFRNSLTQRHGISNTMGLVFLLAYPLWALLLHIF